MKKTKVHLRETPFKYKFKEQIFVKKMFIIGHLTNLVNEVILKKERKDTSVNICTNSTNRHVRNAYRVAKIINKNVNPFDRTNNKKTYELGIHIWLFTTKYLFTF